MMHIHHYPIPRTGCDRIRYMAAFNKQLPHRTTEIRRWCFESFGPPGYLSHIDETRWQDDVKYGEIVFQREEDLTLFLLRWS